MVSESKMLDFLGIGVQKAGTTWLFQCLMEHPGIHGAMTTNNKELNFFNHNYEKGYAWYHRRFTFGPWKMGEYSTLYFPDKNVPARVYRYNPDIKLILSLRNPVDRAYSQHRHEIRRDHIPESLYRFGEALKYNPTYIEQGRYATHLEYWLKFFDLHKIHIILYDEIVSQPAAVLKKLFTFLDLDSDFQPSLQETKQNVAHIYRSRALFRLMSRTSKWLHRYMGRRGIEVIRATKIPSRLRTFNEVDFHETLVPPLSEDELKCLRNEFNDDIERLETLVGKDLAHWKTRMQAKQP